MPGPYPGRDHSLTSLCEKRKWTPDTDTIQSRDLSLDHQGAETSNLNPLVRLYS
jgi:hypothetical protein